MILEKMRSSLWKLELWFWTYSWIHTLGPSGPNIVSRPQATRSIIFFDISKFIGFILYSWKNEKKMRTSGWIRFLGPSHPNVVPRPQAPKSINFLRLYNFNGFFSWFLRKWGLACENWGQGSGLAAGYYGPKWLKCSF